MGVFLSAHTFAARPGPHSADDNLLNASEERALSQIGVLQTYPHAGMPIFREGREAHYVYLVQSGIVRISREGASGSRQVLGFRWAGDLTGLAPGGLYLNSADTLTAVTLYRFSIARLRKLLLREPQIQMHFLVKTADALAAAQRHILWLGQQDVVRRLASLLYEFSQSNSCYDATEKTLLLPVARGDIADFLGTSPESVARAFRKLEQKNLIARLSPRRMMVSNLRQLRQFAFSGDI